MRQTILILTILALSFGCTVTEKTQRSIKYSIQAGLNKGGITDNTDLSIIPNVPVTPGSNIDAFSGATRAGANAGVHLNKPFHFGEIETGFDFMYNHQSFSYADEENMYTGVRKFHVNQIMFPLTYNFVLFKNLLPGFEIQMKFGYLGQFNLINTYGDGILPDYSLNNWSNGATLGLSAYPFQLKKGSKLGFYVDGYRGSRIYTDFYNQEGFEMPGSSFVKFGIRYQFSL